MTVRLRLENALPETTPVLVATRTASDQPWTYVPGELTSDQRHVDYDTTRLDEVGALAVDLESALTGFTADLAAGLTTRVARTTRKPSCAGETEAREQGYAVKMSKSTTFLACFGLEDGKRVVKLTSRMPVPVEVAHPEVPVIVEPLSTPAWAAWAQVLGTESPQLEPGRTSTYDAELEPDTELQISAQSPAAAQSLRVLQATVGAIVLRLTKYGTPPANVPATVKAFLAMPQCAKSLSTTTDALLASCFSQAKLVRVFGSRALLVAPLVADKSTAPLLRQQASDVGVRARTTERKTIVVRREAPDFTAFAAGWSGPRRLLSIDAQGRATETVDNEAGSQIIRLSYQLEDPETQAEGSSATATITAVRVSRPGMVNGRAPRVGDSGTITVRKDVVRPPFLSTRYCTPAAAKRGACGS